MFTVLIKHVGSNQKGRTVLLSAKTVEFVPEGGLDKNPGLFINHGVDGEDGCHLSPSEVEADYRDVFVMNDQGATVARYTL